ncbi:hypothetical protein Avbf_01092 [Armadillidium vulgare]|nr:hypothetical protein Avbf_01092 [Armadillidium vulgare]
MLKLIIGVFLIAVPCIGINNGENITKKECEKRGGKYCLSAGMCYFSLNETVSSYKEAADLCAAKGGTVPFFNIADYANYIKCTGGFPWGYPTTMFLLPFLPDKSENCVSITFIEMDQFTVLNRCSYESKVHVACEIKLQVKDHEGKLICL